MKKSAKSIVNKLWPLDPAFDLTGKRFGKWLVLEYAGRKVCQSADKKYSVQMWLCRCDCGVQQIIYRGNLTSELTTQCRLCARKNRRKPHKTLYLLWKRMTRGGKLPKEWQDFDTFRKVVGEPPDDTARLGRYDVQKPHGPGNTFWMTRSSDPQVVQQRRRKLNAETIRRSKILMKIRNAKTKVEQNRHLLAARKAGYTYKMIGIAAGVSRQCVHQLIAKLME